MENKNKTGFTPEDYYRIWKAVVKWISKEARSQLANWEKPTYWIN